MSGGVLEKMDTVMIPRKQLIVLLDGAKQIRTGFLMCAPRFAAGSRGEQMVALASTFGKTIEEIGAQLNKASDPPPEAEPAPYK